jgi:type VI secretion system secreted protein VgrG
VPSIRASQANQRISVSTPLEEDKLLFKQMFGSEKLGQLFEYELELLSEDDSIEHDELLAENITVCVDGDNGKRYFSGKVSRFSYAGTADGFSLYRATLVPWLWFLTHQSNCRIFQEKTIPEIIKELFKEHGYTDFEENLSDTYNALEYCVQYRETDFNFVSRLMEQEGIYYYFEHSEDKHKLVLTDAVNDQDKLDDIPYALHDLSSLQSADGYIHTWNKTQTVCSGKYALQAFNFKSPSTDLLARASAPAGDAASKSEIYDYPGGYIESAEGDNYAKIRLQELQAGHDVAEGSSNHNQISAGKIFTLKDHPREDQNGEYLVTSAHYQLRSNNYSSGSGDAAEEIYSCQFTATESEKEFRTQRMTAKPAVQGLQTAIVVGPSGEEIYTDEFGRVKVHFHWDRDGSIDENSSCWVRVAQAWAGKNWGGVFLPRIGHEVIVSFLEGDPDRPIITGSVYNSANTPPYVLPEKKTQSGIKSRSSKEGTGENFNELRFEDKLDEEEIYLHAEKDFNQVVENNATLTVGASKKDAGDQSIEIFNNHTLTVGCSDAADGSQTTAIYKDRTTTLETGNDKLEVQNGDRTVTVSNDDTQTIGNDSSLTIGNDGSQDIGNNGAQTIGNNLVIEVGSKSSMDAGQSIELTVGGSSIKIESSGITLKTGGSSIKMEAAKITLKSVGIDIKADATLDAKSPMTTVNGDGMLTLKGGLTKIN